MHKEILSPEQLSLLPLIQSFKREFYLVGGTAIALHIGHRRSIDFDMFKQGKLQHKRIIDKIDSYKCKYMVTRRVSEQLNLIIQGVKLTFFEYPFHIEAPVTFEKFVKMPELLTLAAMKAYALGRRAKWKDYVDLFFIIRQYYTIQEISKKAQIIYGDLFSEKLFRGQLSYFEQIDFTEQVEYLLNPIPENEIKEYLINKAIEF